MSCILSAQMRVIFFPIQIRAIISSQAVLVLRRMIVHILFKKGRRQKREKKRSQQDTTMQCLVLFVFFNVAT